MLAKESNNNHTAGGATPWSAASPARGLLELEATHAVGSFLSPHITLLMDGIPWGRAQLGSLLPLWSRSPPDNCGARDHQPGQGGSGLPSLHGVEMQEQRPAPGEEALGTTLPPPVPHSCYHHLDGHLKGRGWKSLPVLPAKRRQAPSGWLTTERKGFISNQWVKW